ncbi:MAG TPA: preprotein translocase subunit SecE [Firmicutes bacterium]|nr:preprotein translocase subunit SecE [Bacillota bacterium]HHY98687.1 preprotein translocase subunit SecE [Bacillota bacterium]
MELRSIIERIQKYLREVRAELRKVTWPNRKQLGSYTAVVLVTVLVVAGFVGLIDFAFSQILRLFIK